MPEGYKLREQAFPGKPAGNCRTGTEYPGDQSDSRRNRAHRPGYKLGYEFLQGVRNLEEQAGKEAWNPKGS